MITMAQIKAAQNNDLDGITAVLAEMDQRISRLAAQADRRIDGTHREDFEQDAREALFLALPRVSGEDVDAALGFLYSTMADTLKDKVRAERYQGVDKDAVKTFLGVLAETDGDAHKAEALARDLPKGQRLSADRAAAARLAWQGAVSIDRPAGDDDESATLADTLAVVDAVPTINPKVGTGAALEALAVLQRYSSARLALSALPEAAEDVDAIEDAVTLPRDAQVRRFILDAVAILRSYVSTATDGDLVADLRDVADDRKDERAVKVANVGHVLDGMRSQDQAEALRLSYGIAGRNCYGTGEAGDLEGLAEAMGMDAKRVTDARSRGLKSFAKRWIALVAKTEAQALALAEAAAQCLARGGRK
ncbi:hypothetical protein ACWEQ3_01400 [Streptomyces mirabilis]